jgi:hypothetical protein
MAGEIASPAVTVSSTDSLYRGINPLFYDQGQLMSGVFFLKKKDTTEEGPSVGITRLIPLTNFQSYMGAGWGVGELAISVPHSLSLTVHPLSEPAWGVHADAHAVITGYQTLTNTKRTDVARALRNALQKKILVKPTK